MIGLEIVNRLIFLIMMRRGLISPMNFIILKLSILQEVASIYSFKNIKTNNFSILLFNSLDLVKISSFFRGVVHLCTVQELFIKITLFFFININLYVML